MNCQNAVYPLFVTALILAACGDDGDSSDASTASTAATEATGTGDSTTAPSTAPTTGESESGTDTGEPEMTQIRVVHLSPGSPAIDIFANGDGSAPVVNGLRLRSSVTRTMPAGEYQLAVAADGAAIEDAVFTAPARTYDGGKTYTLIAVGKLADDSFDLLRIEESTIDLEPEQVRLKVTHAAAGAAFAEVDVWVGPAADMLNELIPDFPFKDSASADVTPADIVVGLDLDDDTTADALWSIDGTDLSQGVGGVVHVFAYSDGQDQPSLQIVTFDGAATQLDPS